MDFNAQLEALRAILGQISHTDRKMLLEVAIRLSAAPEARERDQEESSSYHRKA